MVFACGWFLFLIRSPTYSPPSSIILHCKRLILNRARSRRRARPAPRFAAREMFIPSITRGETRATAKRTALCAAKYANHRSRWDAESFFESRSFPSFKFSVFSFKFFGTHTAPTTTGPASAPRPTSSNPITNFVSGEARPLGAARPTSAIPIAWRRGLVYLGGGCEGMPDFFCSINQGSSSLIQLHPAPT